MLGLVFWLASPFIQAWYRHRVVLACAPNSLFVLRYLSNVPLIYMLYLLLLLFCCFLHITSIGISSLPESLRYLGA